jgi:hypothetical protein
MPERDRPAAAIRIDHLILDVPGVSADQAPALARAIGQHIAGLGLIGPQRDVLLQLEGDGNVAERIAAALRTEFSR